MMKKEALKSLFAALAITTCACTIHAKREPEASDAPCYKVTRSWNKPKGSDWKCPKNMDEAVSMLEDCAKDCQDKAMCDLICQACSCMKKIKRSPSAQGWQACAEAVEELAQCAALEYCPDVKRGGHHEEHLGKHGNCSKVCKWILEELKECCADLHHLIEKKFPCDAQLPIKEVPVTIHRSGKYCVTKDLVYNGTGTAIVIDADGVTIDFNNHDLTLLDPAATGIGGTGHRELVVKHDIIQAAAPSLDLNSAGIHLVDFEKVSIENCFFKNTLRGIFLESCKDVHVTNSRFKDTAGTGTTGRGIDAALSSDLLFEGNNAENAGTAIRFSDSSNCVIDQLTALNCARAFSFGTADNVTLSKNCRISNVSSTDQKSTNILMGDGFLIENLTATAAVNTIANLLQVGSFVGVTFEPLPGNNVIVTNSSFKAITPTDGTGGAQAVFPLTGENILFENCLITSNATGLDDPDFEDTITIGGLFDFFGVTHGPISNITFRNCSISGVDVASTGIGVLSDVSGLTIDNCTVSNHVFNNILVPSFAVNTNKTIIKNSSIKDGLGNGIRLAGTTSNNTLENNITTNNAGTGIVIEPTSQNNSILNNVASNNGTNYLIPNASNSLDLNNVSFN